MKLPDRFHPKLIIKRSVFGAAALLALVAFPSPVLIAGTSSVSADANQCNPVVPAAHGVTKPTGSAAAAFTYNKCTGLYVSAHYVYNPSTQSYSPLPGSEPTYTCDKSTWQWQETEWQYVASRGDYEQQTFTVSSAPAGYGTCQAPPVQLPPSQSAGGSGGISTNNQPTNASSSSASGTNTNSTNVNSNNSVTLNTNVNSNATSGNVNVSENTSAGNATSGNALGSATVINSVNSSSSGQPIIFTKNIDGNVSGDIIIDPNQLQPSSTTLQNSNNVNLNTSNSGTINNNISVSATSGNVSATKNTQVGNATSGSASAVADVVNMLNTYVGGGQSFIGTININGNFHGNILMPPTFYSSLVASGVPHTTVNLSNTNSLGVNNTSTTSIDNEINSQAKSGSVTQDMNTTAGNATSGNASTNVEIFNLTGQQIVGKNCLLVFVNVLGKWVGVIVNAPSGSQSALEGADVTETSANNVQLNNTTKNSINNNINVSATSGNVNSSENTTAGNATSGNASTGVNLANISGSTLNLSGWFGVLFINVFGTWYGNFGEVQQPTTNSTKPSSGSQGKSGTHPEVFKFVPLAAGSSATNNAATQTYVGSSSGSSPSSPAITLASANVSKTLGARTASGSLASQLAKNDKFGQEGSSKVSWLIISGALVLAAAIMTLASRRSEARN